MLIKVRIFRDRLQIWMLCLLWQLLFFCSLQAVWASNLNVVFVSPGMPQEEFWQNTASVMRAAAHDLGISLEIVHAGKDQLKYVKLVRDVAQRKHKPDYLILTNEKLVGTSILPIIEKAHIKTIFAFSTLNPEQRVQLGEPREKFTYWLGSITSDTELFGARSMYALYQAAKSTKPEKIYQVALIGGDKGTPSGLNRVHGALSALADKRDLALTQVVYGNWQEAVAKVQTTSLLRRYPNLDLIWVANAAMARGAIEAAEKVGRKPGKDIFFSAFDITEDALTLRESGKLSVLAGGQAMVGAAALILLYDYEHGKDFAKEGLEQTPAVTHLIDVHQASSILQDIKRHNYSKIDYQSYSRAYHPQLQNHDFSTLNLTYEP